MSALASGFAFVLLAALLLGLFRVWRGTSFADRMMAAQLVGTTGIGIALLLSAETGRERLLDVALVLSVLALLAVVGFVARVFDPTKADPATGSEP